MTDDLLLAIRRHNFMRLLGEFVAARASEGVSLRSGLESAFAAHLQVHRNLLSQWKKHRPISERSARQIESRCGKPSGWLDEARDEPPGAPDAAEERLVAQVRTLWRDAGPDQRRQLADAVQALHRLAARD